MRNKFLKGLGLSVLVGSVLCCPLLAKSASTPKESNFLAIAAEADMTSANMGKLAEDRGEGSDFKDFAKNIVKDHTLDYEQLTALANKTGEAIPKSIDRSNYQRIKTLNAYKGKAFDREFLTNQTAEHEQLIKTFKEEAEHATNPDIKAYANQALPVLERHLHEAQDLLKHNANKS